MSLPLVYHPKVQEEIDTAYEWYEQQRVGLGDKFLETLRKHLEGIQQNPQMYGVLYRRIRGGPMHRFPYVVYYREESVRIEVVAVQHGCQHPRSWRSRA